MRPNPAVTSARLLKRAPKLPWDRTRRGVRPRVATERGMKGLRGWVKPQGSPFSPGYTDVHPPVCLDGRLTARGWKQGVDPPRRIFYGYVTAIYSDWKARGGAKGEAWNLSDVRLYKLRGTSALSPGMAK
ncbi:hypothetical protein KM043_003582 [Ampulex compressa]|nr:hypothetical protein KM043_003582 [Ampulex compressa]